MEEEKSQEQFPLSPGNEVEMEAETEPITTSTSAATVTGRGEEEEEASEGNAEGASEAAHVELLKASSLRRVPWANWDEWHTMRRWLFEEHNISMAIKRYDAWCSRGKVPLSVDASVQLSRVLYSTDRTEQTRMDGALTLIRFVNGLTETLQTGVYACSVHTVARNAGIPPFLVDIRHTATHSTLPSLETVLLGCKAALKWLEDNYWTPQSLKLASPSEKVVGLLQEYRTVYRDKEMNPADKANKARRCLDDIIMLVNSSSISSMQSNLIQPFLTFLVPNT